MANYAFLPVFSKMYSSPRKRGPLCRSFRIKLFELNILLGFTHFFLIFWTGIYFYDFANPLIKFLGNKDCS